MDQVAAPFAQSLATLRKPGECMIAMEISSLIYTSRDNLVKKAVSCQADAVLFLDSDMIFDSDVLEKMVAHMEAGKDIVSGLYFKRRAPFSPVLLKELDIVDGQVVSGDFKALPDSREPFEVAGCGMGCCMISKGVLLDMLLNCQAWFEPMRGVGEDLSFCLRARELGYTIWCDPSISLGHVGQLIINEKIWRTSIAPERT